MDKKYTIQYYGTGEEDNDKSFIKLSVDEYAEKINKAYKDGFNDGLIKGKELVSVQPIVVTPEAAPYTPTWTHTEITC